MVEMKWVFLLVGIIIGLIVTAIAYHKLFAEFNNSIDDLKNRLKDKNLIITSLQNHVKDGQKK